MIVDQTLLAKARTGRYATMVRLLCDLLTLSFLTTWVVWGVVFGPSDEDSK